MATPPRSQNTSPEFRGDHSFRDVDARDSCFAAEHGGDEPPTPSETPNKSLDLEQSGQNNMLLTSLMQDILSSLSNSCSISGNQDNPAVFADVDTVPGSGVNYQRRYSLPSRFLGVPNSQPYRGGNGGGGGSNSNNFVGSGISRLSRIPEFSPGLMVGSGARMNNTMTDGSRKTDPGSIIGVPFPHAVTSNNPWTPVSNSSSNNNSFYNTGISSSNLPPHSVPHAVAGVAHNITGSGESSVGSGNLTCYLVQFTCGRTDTFYIPHEISLTVSIGDYVVVEADRGEDLGRVIMDNINVPLPRRNSTAASIGSGGAHGGFSFDSFEMPDEGACGPMGGSSQSVLPKKIYRLAAGYEIESLLSKIRDEVNAIAVGQFKVQEWKLPMAITDAEYQWDRRKLTFFFSVTLPQFYPNQPAPRIDFRTLVRDLYQIYRTRIWMFCVDKDKNRSCRSHNREKFLRQLYEDVKPNQKINLAVGAELSTGDSNNSQDNDQKLFNAEKMGLRSAPVTGYSETSIWPSKRQQQQQPQSNGGMNVKKEMLERMNDFYAEFGVQQ